MRSDIILESEADTNGTNECDYSAQDVKVAISGVLLTLPCAMNDHSDSHDKASAAYSESNDVLCKHNAYSYQCGSYHPDSRLQW